MPKFNKLLKLSWAGFAEVGTGLLMTLPDPWVDRGVLRPEAKGEGLGRREERGFETGGFRFANGDVEVEDWEGFGGLLGVVDQLRPARSSIV